MTTEWGVFGETGKRLLEAYTSHLTGDIPGLLARPYVNSNASFPLSISVSLGANGEQQAHDLALEIDFHKNSDGLSFTCDVVKGEIDFGAFGPQSSFDGDSSSLAPWVLRSLADAFEFFEAQRSGIVEALKSKASAAGN